MSTASVVDSPAEARRTSPPPPHAPRSRLRISFASFAIHASLIFFAFICLTPFFWLICAAVKRKEDLYAYMFLPWPHLDRLTLDNFTELFKKEPIWRWLVNSVFLASVTTSAVVLFSSLGGFALAKYRFRGKRLVMLLMLGTMLLPPQVILTSMYELMEKIGWINSYLAILVPSVVSVFGTFLFRQAMQSVPDELLQSGRIDGCSELRLWWEIALPVVRPMLGAYTLLSFLASWNSYFWPQIILQDEAKYTLPIGLSNMVGLAEYQTSIGPLMAGTVLSIVPVAIVFFAVQKDFISGLASGAVKG